MPARVASTQRAGRSASCGHSRPTLALVVAAYQLASDQQGLMTVHPYSGPCSRSSDRLAIWHGVHQLSRPMLTPVSLSGGDFDAAAMTRASRPSNSTLPSWTIGTLAAVLVARSRPPTRNPSSGRPVPRNAANWPARPRHACSAANETPDEKRFFSASAWASTRSWRCWVVEPVDYGRLLGRSGATGSDRCGTPRGRSPSTTSDALVDITSGRGIG